VFPRPVGHPRVIVGIASGTVSAGENPEDHRAFDNELKVRVLRPNAAVTAGFAVDAHPAAHREVAVRQAVLAWEGRRHTGIGKIELLGRCLDELG
jgi:hypothetical protein